jgi:N-methylhydantoinase A
VFPPLFAYEENLMNTDSSHSEQILRIGIDVGGTFTDFIVYEVGKGTFTTYKNLSSPEDPARAVIEGLETILMRYKIKGDVRIQSIIHGSTVATNALLERKGARTALLTTEGFRDVLVIGRQNRSKLYDLLQTQQPPLVPDELRIDISERINAQGEVLKKLELNRDRIGNLLVTKNVESVAVVFLFSFSNPAHELEVARWLEDQGYFVSRSSEVLPEFREYERTSTTVINAYVSPIMNRYLLNLQQAVPTIPIQVMQSNGGSISLKEASNFGVRCILSGPAGGIAAARYLRSAQINAKKTKQGLITFDMGGTSTDVSLIMEKPYLTKEAQIGELPIAIPMLDIHTIGAGGGSIAYLDEGGALRVGPQSAGADPGPACYGKGTLPTVTDANLVLRRLSPSNFLGGRLQLYPERAEQTICRLAEQARLSPEECALGIIEIANTLMVKALRVISVERGQDPLQLSLVSFGGAGGLHAVDLAHALGVAEVIIPPTASVFSAFGMLVADTIKDYSRTIMLTDVPDRNILDLAFEPLIARGIADLQEEGYSAELLEIYCSLDMRYKGQSYEISVPYTGDFIEQFHTAHEALYGYRRMAAPLETVNIRVQAIGKNRENMRIIPDEELKSANGAYAGKEPVIFNQPDQVGEIKPVSRDTNIYQGELLKVGDKIQGPAIILRSDTTILISGEEQAIVDQAQNLIIGLGAKL